MLDLSPAPSAPAARTAPSGSSAFNPPPTPSLLRQRRRAVTRLTAREVARLNPALHRDPAGNAIRMPVSGAITGFIADHVRPGDRTIETGAGTSTLCFLAQGALHTAVAPDAGLEDRLRTFCREHGLAEENLVYYPKRSQDCLWSIDGEYQCVLIDGGHGFPIPFLDFYYLQHRLGVGGHLIIDDLEIWTGEILAKFLSCEPAWKPVMLDGGRAIVFQKIAPVREGDWTSQAFVVRSSLHPFYVTTLVPRPDAVAAPEPSGAKPPSGPPPVTCPTQSSSGPISPSRTIPEAAHSFLETANARLAGGDLRGCQLALQQAHEVAPVHPEILATLAAVTFRLGDSVRARQLFLKTVPLDPGNPVLRVQLGVACLEAEDVPGFESALQKALELDPDCPEALTLLADLNLRAARHSDAAAFYRRLVLLQPTSVGPLLGLAKCLFRLGQPSAAQAVYRHVLALEPRNEVALEALAILEDPRPPADPDRLLRPLNPANEGPAR